MSAAKNYTNILLDRHATSDFMWVSRDFVPSRSNCNAINKTNSVRIHQDVLKSPRIQKIINEISIEKNVPRKNIEKQVSATLKEIGYTDQLPVIRCLAYVLVKILKKIINGIYVNESHLKKIKSQMKDNPVIFLPSHRSYADFILMAFVAFHFDIELPCVAAGMGRDQIMDTSDFFNKISSAIVNLTEKSSSDFYSMWIMGQLLRDTHAFFMRRSFGDDKLYKAVFDEYIQTLVMCGDFPIEFFIEGTRSRTAKSLPPKFGMLSMTLAPLLEEHVSDIIIVPVNLSYDRTLEESLFSYELLGVPKPKESTSGLFKAMRMLDEKYGNVFVNFCEPFSAKEYLRSVSSPASPVVDLAFSVIDRQQQNCVLSCFNLISMILTNHLLVCEEPLFLKQIISDVTWLQSIMQELSANVIFSKERVSDSVEEAIQLHKSLVKLSTDGAIYLVSVDLAPSQGNRMKLKGHQLKDETMLLSIPLFTLQHYVNPCLYFLVNMTFVTIILRSNREISDFSRDDVFQKFLFLRRIFSSEFILCKRKEEEDFAETLKRLELVNIIEEPVDLRLCLGNHFKLQSLLCNLFYPFFSGYLFVFKCLSKVCSDWLSEKALLQKVQAEVETELLNGGLLHPYPLSIELILSALNSLQSMDALQKVKTSEEVKYKAQVPALSSIVEFLEPLVIRPLESSNSSKMNIKQLLTFSDKRAKL